MKLFLAIFSRALIFLVLFASRQKEHKVFNCLSLFLSRNSPFSLSCFPRLSKIYQISSSETLDNTGKVFENWMAQNIFDGCLYEGKEQNRQYQCAHRSKNKWQTGLCKNCWLCQRYCLLYSRRISLFLLIARIAKRGFYYNCKRRRTKDPAQCLRYNLLILGWLIAENRRNSKDLVWKEIVKIF